jgi:hypothetical protein
MSDIQRTNESIIAENNFSDWIYVGEDQLATLTLQGTWVATVTVQFALHQDYVTTNGSPTAIDLDTKTANGRWDWPGGGDWWRFGVKTSGFTSGTVAGTIQGRGSD